MTRSIRLVMFVSVVIAAMTAVRTDIAVAEEISYSGERVRIVVPFREGGGTDTFTRFLAPFFEKHLPGNPRILVQNEPGGGGLKGATAFVNAAKPDGLTLFASSASIIATKALGNELASFDLSALQPVLLQPWGSVLIGRSEVVEADYNLEMLRGSDAVLVAVRGPTSSSIFTLWMLDKLDIPVKPAVGLSTTEAQQAFLRGELTVQAMAAADLPGSSLIADGIARPLFAVGYPNDDGTSARDPVAPDVPSFPEVYEATTGGPLSDAEMETYLTALDIQVSAGKSWLLPADAPADVVETWLKAARAVVADPEFQADREAQLGPYALVIGEAAGEIIRNATVLSRDSKKELNGLYDRVGIAHSID